MGRVGAVWEARLHRWRVNPRCTWSRNEKPAAGLRAIATWIQARSCNCQGTELLADHDYGSAVEIANIHAQCFVSLHHRR